MKQYVVTGMSCAACSARVEKAVNAVEGVTACSVSLLTNSMGVEGTALPQDIINAVTNAGYKASLKAAGQAAAAPQESELEDKESPKLKARLIASLGFLAVLLYVSMGHMIFKCPLPAGMAENPVAIGLTQMLLAIIIMVINQRFFISGFLGIIHRAPNMDTLVSLGSAASFVWSAYILFSMSSLQQQGKAQEALKLLNDFYFESAAMILALITVGKLLEARSKGKTTNALKSLMRLAPKTAVLIKNGKEQAVPVEQVLKGDCYAVKPGESIPVDGVVLKGTSAVNEAALTGESLPIDKAEGDFVSAGTINQSGYLECEAVRVGQDTTISQIIKMVSDAAATKAPISRIADKVSGVFVPVVILIAVITAAIWLLCVGKIGFALAMGISVLVVSCPCALGLATPVAIMVGSGVGAKSGILFKTAVSLENVGKAQIVALDKTGTITKGEPKVTRLISLNNTAESELLSLAYSLEQKSEHPLAKAIAALAKEKSAKAKEISEFNALPGNGLKAVYNGKELVGGSLRFIKEHFEVSQDAISRCQELASQGQTPLLFAYNSKLLGIIAVADVIKEESPQAVKELQGMGIKVVMLTGDNEQTANAIGKEAGVDFVIAGVMPDGKEAVISRLQKYGRVAMAGDGINDSPALTRADIGIAIGAGTDVAIDAADIVLVKSKLTDVAACIRLGRATLTNIKQNLCWAFFYNILGIPIAAGAFAHWGLKLNPMIAAAAMSLSSFCVVTNALRLNLFKLHEAAKDRRREPVIINQADIMPQAELKKQMKITGMKCPHCESAVKKALEALEQVETASVSHKEGTALLKLKSDITNEELIKAVVNAGFKVAEVLAL